MTASIIGSRSVGISSNDLKKLQRFLVAKAKNPLGGQADEMSAVLNAAVENKTTPFTRAQVEKGSNLFEQLSQQFGVDPNETSLTENEKAELESAQETLQKRKDSYEKAKGNYYDFLAKVELEGRRATKFKGSWVEKLKARYKRWRFNRGRAEKFTEFVESHTQTQDNSSSLSVDFIKNKCKNLLAEMVKDENFTLDAWNREMKSYKTIQDLYSRRENENTPEMIGLKAIINVISNSLVNKNHYLNALNTLQNTTVVLENDAEKGKELFTKAKEQIDKFEWKEGNIGFFSKEKMIEKLNEKVAEIETQYPELKASTKDDSLDKIKQDALVIKNRLSSEISGNANPIALSPEAHLASLMKKFKNLAGDDQSKYTPEQTEVFNLLSDIENSHHNRQLFFDNQSAIRTAFAKYNSDKNAGYDEIKKLAPMLEANAGKYLNASNYSADWCNKTLADFFEEKVAKYPELKQKLENGGPQPTPGTAPTSGGQPEPQPTTSGSKPGDVSDLQYKTLYERLKQQDAEEIARLKQELARKEEELASSKEINETLNAQLAQQTADSELAVQKKALLEKGARKNAELANEMRRIGDRITDLDFNIRSLENGFFNRYREEWRYELLNDPNMKDYLQQLEYAPNKEQILENVLNDYMQRKAPEKINALKEEKAKLEATVNKLEAERQKIMAEEKEMRRVYEQYESAKRQNMAGMGQFGQNLSSVNIQQQEFNNASFTDNMTEEGKRIIDEIFSQGSMQSGFKR